MLVMLFAFIFSIESIANEDFLKSSKSGLWSLTIQCPEELSVDCIGDLPIVDIASVTYTDTCGGNATVRHISDISDGNSCPETILRTYEVEDSCGNIATCTQVIIISDIISPIVSEPADLTIDECDIIGAFINNPLLEYSEEEIPIDQSQLQTEGISASDNCNISNIIYFDNQVGEYCPIVVLRTFHITDDCGNLSVVDYNIIIQDTYPPFFREIPEDITVYCDEIPEPPEVTAKDNCSCASWITFTEISNTVVDCEGTIVRQWVAEDDCGNNNIITQTITVIPNTSSIEEPALGMVAEVYPNPNKGNFRLKYYSSVPSPIRIIISDLSGREVYYRLDRNAGLQMDQKINIEHIPAGVYFLRLVSDNDVITRLFQVAK